MNPEVCPNCGEMVPRMATACPGCGSDEKTGWSEKAYADNLSLPDEDFNYAEFVRDEFNHGIARPRSIHWLWWLTAFVLIVLFLIFCLH